MQALFGSAGVPTVGNVLPQAAKVSWLKWAASASACAGLSACYQWQLTIPKQPASAASWKKFHREAAAIFSPTITAGFSPAQPSFHLWQLHVYLHPHSMFKWVVLQDLFRRKGAQELKILKDVNGVLKPVEWPASACACCTHVHTGGLLVFPILQTCTCVHTSSLITGASVMLHLLRPACTALLLLH